MNPLEKLDSFYFRFFPVVFMTVFFATIVNRLAMMQLDGLLGASVAFTTSLFATCSLLYARARAVTDPAEMEARAKIADESLKAALITVMGLGVTAYIFAGLIADYPMRVGHILDKKGGPEVTPALTAFACIMIFGVPVVAKMMHVVEETGKSMGLLVKASKPTIQKPTED
ncbi:hypothetical protein [Massilia sp. BKSP1R2A-1]|uniref:hypothetical protein n=1 Tax=Massilia sp. BKSP1R2A-1 TaxID=3422595 RepID=UPI003D353E18